MTLHPLEQAEPAELAAVWNAALGREFPLRPELLRQALGPDAFVDPGASCAWIEDGRPVGFAIVRQVPAGAGPAPGPRAWLSALVVHPGWQRRGVGTRLLRQVRVRIRTTGHEQLRLGGDPFHLFPGVPEASGTAFWQRRGAHLDPVAVVDVRRSLAGWTEPPGAAEALAAAGALVRPATAGTWDALLAFLQVEFPYRWTWEAGVHRRRGGSPGDYLLLEAGGAVAGFARIYRSDVRPVIGPSMNWAPLLAATCGGLGPIGIAAACRGRGLGLAFLARAVSWLREQGVRELVIDWTDQPDFYRRLGFAPWKRYYTGYIPT